ncbi:MAG: glucodextranase DOMON-like domain-containing protein [Chloroflexota bacterium]|nr:glucodextranase DOMON-like domain-containing protein [Chloroflexota bacterium]
MNVKNLVSSSLLLLNFLLVSCAPTLEASPSPVESSTPAGVEAQEEDVLFLNLLWHQHQPLYYKDEQGVYTRPWARAHATKDYYDMAALVAEYPDVKVTFNLTPVLIRQLLDLADGTKDYYRVLTEIPASDLSEDEKRFILERFFDANWDHIIARFPRYVELLNKRGRSVDAESITSAMASFSEQDFRDLQIWWNLAWFDPSFLEEEPLKAMVEKGRDFDEEDKKVLFQEVDRIVAEIIPLHKELQDRGQIEVIITPLAHPILPLLYSTDLAEIGDPSAELPERFSYPNDAIAQLAQAVDLYEELYGRPVRGSWPSEGAVAQEIVKLMGDAGFTWMATGEHVLAKSLGMDGFTRDSKDTIQEADALYRPYYVQHKDEPKLAIVFRDLRMSDLVGFEYSGDPGEQAAQDFIDRLEAIRSRLKEEGAEGPHLVSVILDGENAWENYDNDGIEFLDALYRKLGESETIKTITPSEYLEQFPDQRKIEDLWPGAWFSSDYGTWIGEPEENTAWEYLREVRKDLAPYDITEKKSTDPEKLAEALDFMYLAEGSDWFWWYGSDQDSGADEYFDEAYRALLRGVYESLGEEVPDFVSVPIIPAQAAPATRQVQAVLEPQIDGRVSEGEWDDAGMVEERGGAQGKASDVLSVVHYGYDPEIVYLRIDSKVPWAELGEGTLGIYSNAGGTGETAAFSRAGGGDTLLGFGATGLIEVELNHGIVGTITMSSPSPLGLWSEPVNAEDVQAVSAGDVIELAIPFLYIGEPRPGDQLNLRVVWSEGTPEPVRDIQVLPSAGPIRMVLPDLSDIDYFLVVEDPAGDDYGPGTYAYPSDPVFESGVYDAARFSVGVDRDELVFKIELNGPINNPWGSGINLSVQTFDIYIDFDPGDGTGALKLLEGRNASLEDGNGWDMAVWVEGWHQKVFVPDNAGVPREVSGDNVRAIVDPKGSISIRVKASALPILGADAEGDWALDPTNFGYVGVILSQEGFPSPGVRRVRDVVPVAEQWRLGGGPDDSNHTRIIDVLWAGDHTAFLADYESSQDPSGDLGPEAFARIPLIIVE